MNDISSNDFEPVYTSYIHEDESLELDFPKHWDIRYDPNQKLCLMFSPGEDQGAQIIVLGSANRLDLTGLDTEQDIQELLYCTLEQTGIASDAQPSTLLYYPSHYAKMNDGSHTWATIHNGLLLLIQVTYDDSQEHIYRPIFERMLSSIRIDCKKPSVESGLLEEVAELLRERMPGLTCEINGNRISMDSLDIGVDNLSLSINRQPELRQELLEEFVGTAISVIQQRQVIGQETWEQIRPMLFPMIRPDTIVHSLSVQATAGTQLDGDEADEDPDIARSRRLVHNSWLADLVICYAIDSPMTLRMVSEADLQRWGTDAAQLHQVAMDNLANGSLPEFAGMPGPDGKLILGGFGDGGISTKSSYLLYPNLYDLLRSEFKGSIWAAIPARDTLMIFSSEHMQRDSLLNLVAKDYADSDHALSDRIFEITADGIALA